MKNNPKIGKTLLAILSFISIGGAIGGSSAFAIYYVYKNKNNDAKHKEFVNSSSENKSTPNETKIHSKKEHKNNSKPNEQKEIKKHQNKFINKDLPTTIDELKSKYPSYYGSLDINARGQNLFNALNKIQQKYRNKVGSYDALWSTYQVFEDKYDEKDGTLYDIYSEKIGKKDDFNFILHRDRDRGHHSSPGDSYNREHLIPQSYFGKKTKHIHNDAHFVFPTDSSINGYRNHYPHDEITNASQSGNSLGGNDWKMGNGKNTGKISFEPDDNFKGDIARAYFYFQLTWHNYSHNGYRELARGYAPFIDSFPYFNRGFLDTYKKWSNNDPVSKFEIYTNKGIAQREGGLRNPFIDMPELISLIWS